MGLSVGRGRGDGTPDLSWGQARLSRIAAPTLVLAGELDNLLPPRVGALVAAEIPHARFEVMDGEAHQPFQEVPEQFNARVDPSGATSRQTAETANTKGRSRYSRYPQTTSSSTST